MASAVGEVVDQATTAAHASGTGTQERLPGKPAHHRKGGFDNPWPTWEDRSFFEILKWAKWRRDTHSPPRGWLRCNLQPTPADYAKTFPVNAIDWHALAHPPAGCPFVLISHNHYDHLDSGTVARLNQRFGAALTWYVPLGLKRWFTSAGVATVVELDWWESARHPGTKVEVTFTPAQHWSMRVPWERKTSLWGSFAVRGPRHSFWFAGDTGYCPVFPEIGERLGPFDLAAIPIGAYEPRWFLCPQHCDPQEAVKIHKEVRSKRSIGIHFGTFPLGDEAEDAPADDLKAALATEGVPAEQFLTVQHGGLLQTANGVDARLPPLLPV